MEKLINFTNIIAWVSFVLSFLLVCTRVYGSYTYSELEKQLDRAFGVYVTFPITKPIIVFVVSVVWLAS